MANSKNKNPLSKNVPVHSDLHDIEADLGFKLDVEVKSEDAVERPAPKYDMDIGWHTVRVAALYNVPFQTKRNKFGEEYTIEEHWEIVFEDVRNGDKSSVSVDKSEKAENSFKRAINQRSDKDLGYKLARAEVKITDISIKQACLYCKKNPIQMLYDFSEWVDKDTGEFKRSKYPKLQLWVASDFEDTTPKNRISLD